MRLRRSSPRHRRPGGVPTAKLAALTVGMVLATTWQPFVTNAAAAGPRPDFQLPFPCGQEVRMESFGHAPALDIFRVPTSATEGNPLVAPADGVVNQSFFHHNAGNLVQIDHGGGWFTTAIHLKSRAVRVGERVSQGERIGRVGHTGPTSNGVPHVHFEQAIDRNGDGEALWGFPNEERTTQVYNGVAYGTANSRTYHVTSRNCGDRPPPIRFDAFARGSSNQLVHTYYRAGEGWSGWESLGGRLTSQPDVTSREPGRLDVYARNADNNLVHRFYISGEGWSGWVNLGGRLSSGPGVTSWGPNRIDVFVRDHNNDLAHRWYRAGEGWSGWVVIGHGLTSAPDAASRAPGELDVVAQGANNDILHWWYDNGEWHQETIRADITAGPSITSAGRDRVDIYAREAGSGHLIHKWYRSDSGWHGFEDLGGELSRGPDAASWRNLRNDVFVRGTNNRLYHTFYTPSGGWRDFTNLGGNLTSAPTAVSWNAEDR